MHDFFGNEVKVGDEVMYPNFPTKDFGNGIIERITDVMAYVDGAWYPIDTLIDLTVQEGRPTDEELEAMNIIPDRE